MDAYVASARIVRASPRLAPAWHADRAALDEPAGLLTEVVAAVLTPDGRAVERDPTLADRWAAFRERWAQLTFYVADPESWR